MKKLRNYCISIRHFSFRVKFENAFAKNLVFLISPNCSQENKVLHTLQVIMYVEVFPYATGFVSITYWLYCRP